MRVAMYYSNQDIRIEEMAKPQPGPGEMVVRIEASGICGTDVIEWYRVDRVPLVLGHEIAGVVDTVGEGVRDFKPGDRVSVSHHVPCNKCRYCLIGHHSVCDTLRSTHFHPGGFSEYVLIPSVNVDRGTYLLPEELSFEEATFIEPLACVLRGQRFAGFRRGQTVVVLGSGLSGQLHIQMARLNGASKVIATDVSPFRLEAALKSGADLSVPAAEDVPALVRKANNGRTADRVVICTGAREAMLQAFECIDRGGTILFFAATDKGVTVPLSVNDTFWRNEVTLTSSYAGSPPDHVEAMEILRSGAVNVADMITHRFPLEQTGKGFQLVAEARDSLKVIIAPQK